MKNKKIIFLAMLAFLLTSCAGTWDSVKRGLTGAKSKSTDEFLVKKKDPLTLPPDFEKLPLPTDEIVDVEDLTEFEKTLQETSIENTTSSEGSSAEETILKKIRKQ